MTEPPWITEARKYIGQKEIPGPRTNALIQKWWALIRAPFTDDETPWCAGFVGGCLEAVGLISTRSASSLSYLKYGVPLRDPVVGAIAVKRRVGGGHVTFVVGKDPSGNLWCLGGNQNDSVSIALYPATTFEAFRWPTKDINTKSYPLPVIASRSTVSNVREA